MAVPAHPNAASFSDIQSNFGGSNPISLNEYYAGGTNTRSGTGVHTPNGIPASGAISVFDFMGGSNFFESWSTTITEASSTFIYTTKGYESTYGAMADTTPNQGAMNGAYTITASYSTSVTPKGLPTAYSYLMRVDGPTGLSNDDLSAFKTLTVNGRGTFSRSDAAFTNLSGNTLHTWNWTSQPSSVDTPAPATSVYTLTNA